MYEKIKATKNKRLGTASLMATVAVLMSCAALIPERFGLGGATSTYANSIYGRPRFRGNGFGFRSFGDGFGYDRQKTVLTGEQIKNFEIFENSVKTIDQAFDGLSLNNIAREVGVGRQAGLTLSRRAVDEVLKEISSWEDYRNLGKLATDKNHATQSAKLVVNNLKRVTEIAHKICGVLVDFSTVLDFPRIKNDEKISKANALDEENKLTPMLKIAQMETIVKSDRKRKLAKALVEEAIKCYWMGIKLGESSDRGSVDSLLSTYMRHDEKGVLETANSSSSMSALVSVLQTILSVNVQINKLAATVCSLRASRGLIQCAERFAQGLPANNENDLVEFSKLLFKKSFLNAMSDRFPYLLAMPLVLTSNYNGNLLDGRTEGSYGIDPALVGYIKSNNGEFLSRMVKAFTLKDRQNPVDLVNSLNDYTNAVRHKMGYNNAAGGEIKFNFGSAFGDAMGFAGISPRTVLAGVDAMRLKLYNEGSNRILSKATDANAKKRVQDYIDRTVSNYNADVDGKYLFMRDGAASGGAVDAVLNNAVGGSVDFVANALALPDTIKYQALLRCYIKDLSNASYSTSNWGSSGENWVTGSAFMSGAEDVVRAVTKHYDSAKSLIDKLQKIKNESVSDEDKSKEKASVDSRVTSVVSLTGGNSTETSVQGSFRSNSSGNLDVHVTGIPTFHPGQKLVAALASKTGEVSFEKDKTNKNSKKDSEGPNYDVTSVGEVNNGSVTIGFKQPFNAGNYELHLQALVPGEKASRFVNKFKFEVDADKFEKVDALEARDKQASAKVFDSSKSYIFKDKDNRIIVDLKGVDSFKKLSKPLVVFFRENEPANLDRDMFILQYYPATGRYCWVSRPVPDGKYQIHVYDTAIAEGNWIADWRFDTTKLSDVSVEDLKGKIGTYVSKSDRSRESEKGDSKINRTIRIKLPSEIYDGSANDEVEVSVYSKDSERCFGTQSVKLREVGTSRRDYWNDYFRVYSLSLNLPQDKDVRIRIPVGQGDVDYDVVESEGFNTSKQSSSTALEMHPYHNRDSWRGFGSSSWLDF